MNWDHLRLYREVHGLMQSCLKQQDMTDIKMPTNVPSIPMYFCAREMAFLRV